MKHKQKPGYYVRQHLALSILLSIPFFILVAAIITSKTFQLGGTLITGVTTDEKVVALSFDDGPQPPYSDELRGLLDERQVKATFFLIGLEMQRYPDTVSRLVASGHQIGNHSTTHNSLVFMSQRTIAREIETTDQLIRDAGYRGDIYVRPPYGRKFIGLPAYLSKTGRPTMMWSMSPDGNGEKSKDEIVATIRRDVRPGSIIIMHGMYAHNTPTRQAVPAIIDALRADGYRFVTISELLTY